jgi:uncharacterized membrane protein
MATTLDPKSAAALAQVSANATAAQQSTAAALTKFESVDWVSIIFFIIIGALLIYIGYLGLSIYGSCPSNNTAGINKSASAFAIGFGAGILAYVIILILSKIGLSGPSIPIIVFSLVIIIASIIAIERSNKLKGNCTTQTIESSQDAILALLGIGFGVLITYITLAIFGFIGGVESVAFDLIKYRIFAIILCLFVIGFASININTYNKCGSSETQKSNRNFSIGVLVAAIVILILVVISFFLLP